jgi:putative transcriptional regulator
VKNDIAKRRTDRGWSQAHLAEELGVSRQTIISLEKGRFDPSHISLEKGRFDPSLPLAFRLAGHTPS